MTLLTAAEAARLLRLSERTLERLRCQGFGPKFVKLNHQLADLGADELSSMLIAQWEDDALRELAKRITDHLTKKSSLVRPEISSGATNPAPAVRRPI